MVASRSTARRRFQSSVPPKRDCNGPGCHARTSQRCFNPQSLRRGTATWTSQARASGSVSFNPQSLRRGTATVSGYRRTLGRPCFNPQSLRRGTATVSVRHVATHLEQFQSSVPPKRDCNRSRRRRRCTSGSFNPQSLRRGTATRPTHCCSCSFVMFQSSVPPKRDCNPEELPLPGQAPVVSILSPSEEGLQRVGMRPGGRLDTFQSSVPPKRDCNLRSDCAAPQHEVVSILSPSEEGLQPGAVIGV